MKKILMVFLVLACCLSFLPTTRALAWTTIPAVLDVDLRTWIGAYNQRSYTVGNVTATPIGGKLFQDSIDGLGVRGGENDEINVGESLTFTISGGMNMTGVWITDLFAWAVPEPGENFRANEFGYLILNGTTRFDFVAVDQYSGSGGSNGNFFVDFGTTFRADSIQFFAGNNDPLNEYSVAGFEGGQVPIPGAVWLLGSGLLGLIGVRRKKD